MANFTLALDGLADALEQKAAEARADMSDAMLHVSSCFAIFRRQIHQRRMERRRRKLREVSAPNVLSKTVRPSFLCGVCSHQSLLKRCNLNVLIPCVLTTAFLATQRVATSAALVSKDSIRDASPTQTCHNPSVSFHD